MTTYIITGFNVSGYAALADGIEYGMALPAYSVIV